MTKELDDLRTQEFDLEALCEASKVLLLKSGIEPGDERVSAYPDARTVRYYQSLGLLEKPLRYEGRKAVYNYDHLLRVVAVKLLQAEGQSLAQVQRVVPRITREQLEEAVSEALALPPRAVPVSLPPPSSLSPQRTGRSLLSWELRPGLIVTIDPQLVPNSDAVLDSIRSALAGRPSKPDQA